MILCRSLFARPRDILELMRNSLYPFLASKFPDAIEPRCKKPVNLSGGQGEAGHRLWSGIGGSHAHAAIYNDRQVAHNFGVPHSIAAKLNTPIAS